MLYFSFSEFKIKLTLQWIETNISRVNQWLERFEYIIVYLAYNVLILHFLLRCVHGMYVLTQQTRTIYTHTTLLRKSLIVRKQMTISLFHSGTSKIEANLVFLKMGIDKSISNKQRKKAAKSLQFAIWLNLIWLLGFVLPFYFTVSKS